MHLTTGPSVLLRGAAWALVFLLVAGCRGDADTPATTGNNTADTAQSTTTFSGSTTGLAPRPQRWFGVADGAVVVAEGGRMAPVVEPGAFEGFGSEPAMVRLGAETLFLSFCCEPADGIIAALDLASGTMLDFGTGVAASATADDRWLRVLTNGMQVAVEAPGADPMSSTAREFLMPSRSALSPDGDLMAVVGVTAGEDILLAVEPGTVFLEDGVELARGSHNRVTPNNPVIDAEGQVWYVEDSAAPGCATRG